MENVKKGYCIITYKFRIYTNKLEDLRKTKDLYNETILFYYDLLFDNQNLLELGNQNCLRELEKLTVIGKDNKIPKNYLKQELPTYFRRAAINQAIGAMKKYLALCRYAEENKKTQPSKTMQFNNSPLFYKGMYKNLEGNTLELKLWNEKEWKWSKAKIKGKMSEDVEIMSPTIVVNKNYAIIHIPVREEVSDVTPVKERMHNGAKVCGISFLNDNFATCVILDNSGNFVKAKFIEGGKEYQNRTSKIFAAIKKHRQVNTKLTEKDHKSYWNKLANIRENTAHKVSKEIVEFCVENDVKIIAMSKQEENIKAFEKHVAKSNPVFLKPKIISDIKYKAFRKGILVTEVRQNYTASKCYKCRCKVKRKGDEFECDKGHKGNYFFNTAMNIGKMSLKKFGV